MGRYTLTPWGPPSARPPAERGAAGWWDALRRRKVVQWGLLFVAGAWGFLQGLEYVSDAFQWPPAVRQVALLAALVGLPVVLVLAWYHGDRGEQHFRGTEVVIVALLFLLGGGIFWYYQRASGPASAPAPPPPSAAAFAIDASIAVLPFVNMSPDKDQEYFADGISEELLNLLAQVPELRVIARTSSFSFKGKDVDIADIARKLNVANVLEGGFESRVTPCASPHSSCEPPTARTCGPKPTTGTYRTYSRFRTRSPARSLTSQAQAPRAWPAENQRGAGRRGVLARAAGALFRGPADQGGVRAGCRLLSAAGAGEAP